MQLREQWQAFDVLGRILSAGRSKACSVVHNGIRITVCRLSIHKGPMQSCIPSEDAVFFAVFQER
jgi:hypothetical protein